MLAAITFKDIIKTKLFFLFLLVIINGEMFAQLSGTKTIDNTLPTSGSNYNSFNDAIYALNTAGVGSGGVTFNVTAGQAFYEMTMYITATGTATDPIVFQKSGSGANPIIVGTSGISTSRDGCVKLKGTDYITFDGIDVRDNPANATTTTQFEFGYLLSKVSGTNGCQYVTIKNCRIVLRRVSTNYGIYSSNQDTAGTSITVTTTDGSNSYNKFYSNTIDSTYYPIYIVGYNATSPYTLFDQNNEVGNTSGTGNTISVYGGSTTTAYAIYSLYQNNIIVNYNTTTSGSGTTTTLYGIYFSTGVNSNVTVSNNTVTVTGGATTSTLYGINNAMGGTGTSNTVTITNNTIENCTYSTATTGTCYLLYNTASAYNLNMSGNIVRNNTKAGTGSWYLLYNSGSVVSTVNLNNNSVYGNSSTGSGSMYLFYNNPTTTTNTTAYGNNVYSNSSSSTSLIYCFYFSTGLTNTVYQNNIYSNSTTGSTVYGIYHSSGTTGYVGSFYRNNIYNLSTTSTSGIVYGFYQVTGATNYIYNNFFSDLKATASSNTNAVTGIYISGGTTVGIYYNSIFLNASSSNSTFGSSGIYASTSPTVDMRNNIVYNNSTPGNGSYTAKTVAYRRSSNSLTTYSTNSNNNCFYAGTADSSRVIYFDGGSTAGDQTIAAYKARMATRDQSSFSENVTFVNKTTAPYNLHINTSTATQIESGGTVISSPVAISDDYDGNTRSAT
ncbi:MAG: hypothetical protein EPN88_03610, partial [Bacteroidetes bacterium]